MSAWHGLVMRALSASCPAICAAFLALGCGSSSAPSSTSGTPPASPLTGDNETWTWNAVEGAYCADGNPTGLAVNLTNKSPNAVIFLMGGGACWDYETCYGASSSAVYISPGFGESDMPFLTLETSAVGLLSRDDPKNPFRDYSVVSVPYCTGDAFTGSHTATYQGMPTRHVGHANIMAYLPHIVATFPNAERIVLVGASAGGIGAAFHWWHTQQAFGKIRVDLIDDSGAALPAPYLMPSLAQTWQNAWDIDKGLPPDCKECPGALDAIVSWSANNIPNSRGALLAFSKDSVLPHFFSITEAQFTAGLDLLAKNRLDGLPRFRYFFADQSSHVLMVNLDLTQNGVRLWDWIPQMVDDDPSWTSVHP